MHAWAKYAKVDQKPQFPTTLFSLYIYRERSYSYNSANSFPTCADGSILLATLVLAI